MAREVNLGDSSILDDLYAGSSDTNTAPKRPPRRARKTDTPATPDEHVSHTPDTQVGNVSPTGSPKKSSTRTPAGKTRWNAYVDAMAAAEVDQAADRIVNQFGGLLTKHEVLAELLRAAAAAEAEVAKRLKATILARAGQQLPQQHRHV